MHLYTYCVFILPYFEVALVCSTLLVVGRGQMEAFSVAWAMNWEYSKWDGQTGTECRCSSVTVSLQF